jgi:hypothetical protein
MRQSLLGIAAAMVLLGAGATTPAQIWRSFDPNLAQTSCEKELAPPQDDAASKRNWAIDCADLDIKIEQSEFDMLSSAAEKGSKAEQNAYNALVSAFETFKRLDLDIQSEECGEGSDCDAMVAQIEAQRNYEFLLMAEGFRGAGFPSFSAGQADEADAELNDLYRQSNLDQDAELQAMEITWVRYRDAWVAYGAIKWPEVTADSWRAYLTLQHIGPGGNLQLGDF